ncbi:uncharacterized protein NESG_01372 [Nematocida ausubeli]|uniref:Uncharacterized protein n=1 Tax=Nematocida ausubeli (strain ATCC PRA-371 / ERTm2) TaxID=1913371 RepID=A0A086J285_NEMA1|nr:uncharacterized protein NESG_01372 [Nematocida ausubeli]KFG26253.1 hypothetical protein NESG_01372 [Nematocida ausubeli]
MNFFRGVLSEFVSSAQDSAQNVLSSKNLETAQINNPEPAPVEETDQEIVSKHIQSMGGSIYNIILSGFSLISTKVFTVIDNQFELFEGQFSTSISSTFRCYFILFLFLVLFLFSYAITIINIALCVLPYILSISSANTIGYKYYLGIALFVNLIIYIVSCTLLYIALAMYIGILLDSYYSFKNMNSNNSTLRAFKIAQTLSILMVSLTNLMVLYYKTELLFYLGGATFGVAINFLLCLTFIGSNILILKYFYHKVRSLIRGKIGKQYNHSYMLGFYSIIFVVAISLVITASAGNFFTIITSASKIASYAVA